VSAREAGGSTTGPDLIQGREAFERRDWATAFQRLSGAGELGPDDTMALATAAFLIGEVDAAVRAWQHGYQDRVRAGDGLAAVRCACWIGLVLNLRGEGAVAAGWVARAQRILETEPEDIVERGYLLIFEFYAHLGRGDLARAEETGAEVVRAGRRFGHPDLVAQGLVSMGRVAIYLGRVREGLALLDEAMVGISAGEVSPVFAGMVYCAVIEGCQELADYSRMSSWTRALTQWCEAQPGLVPYTGQCSLHRGQILRLHGGFEDALVEFSRAQHRAETGFRQSGAAAAALRERGDLLRIRGRLADAETAYQQSVELGFDPQPGLAMCWLARGRTTAAVTAIRRLLTEAHGPVQQSRLLPSAVEVLLVAGELDEARRCAQELTDIGSAFGFAAPQAAAAYATATVALRAGEHREALDAARTACQLWTGIAAPYEAARARVVLAQVLQALGDEDSAKAELSTARAAFVELGAAPAVHDVDQLQGRSLPGGLTERELEVLRLVAEGRSNPDIARVLVLSHKTVARHLSNIFTKLDVSSRTAAAAYAHEHGLTV
jgi:ATP/maltotriose-dependent transcriptional regulator MalT